MCQTLRPQLGWDVVTECVPLGGEEPSGVDGQPVDVGSSTGTDRGENKGTDSFRVTFGVGRSEDRTPGDPEHDPPLDAEMFSELLDVVDVVIHVDARPVHAFVAGVRGAPSCRSLVEQHGPMALEVERAPSPGRAARARPAMQIHNRRALPGADLLVVEDMPVADIDVPGCKGFGSLFSHPGKYVGARPCHRPTVATQRLVSDTWSRTARMSCEEVNSTMFRRSRCASSARSRLGRLSIGCIYSGGRG